MRKTSKKALCLLLSLVMALTSLSVGFTAFAADDPYQTLVDALKADGVQNASWPGSAQQTGKDDDGHTEFRVTMNDPTGDIEAAAEAFWAVATTVAPNHTAKGQRDDNNTLLGVKNEILNTLQTSYGVSGDLLTTATAALNAFTAFQKGDADASGTFSRPSVPQNRDYVFEIVRGDLAGRLMAYDSVSDIPDTLYGGVQYDWWHDAQDGGSFFSYWRNLVLQTWTRTELSADTTTPATLKAFAAFFTDDLLASDLEAMDADELAQLCSDIQAQIDAMAALNLWGNDEVMNHFFDKDAIQDFKYAAETARDTAYAVEYATQIKEAMDANDPAAMEHDALTALYSQLTSLRTSLLGCTADAQAAGLEAAGITMDQVDTYIASVNEEIEVDNLEGYKAAVDAAIATVPVLTEATDDALLSANAVARQQWALISTCTQGAIDRVFTDGTTYVTDFIHNTQVEMDVRELSNEGITNFGEYFAVHMATDLTTVATDDLINNYRTPDRAQFDEMAKYEQEAVDRVYGEGYYASVEAYIASIDTTLKARVEAQIDEAVDNYQEYGQITILNYKEVQAAIGGVETQIIDTIGLSDEYQAKYNTFSAMMDEYNEFVNSNGVSGWLETPDVDYPTRETPMAGDMARTADEAYEVTPEKLDTVISSLDSLMSNEDLSNVLGLDTVISELIKGAINDNLYTDEMVNTLVKGVYGALVDTLSNLDLGSLGTLLNLVGGIDGLLEDLKIVIYPSKLADYIHDDLYPEAAAAMRAAGSDWNAYDMTVTWHVTDKESFVNAVSYALSGLQTALWPLLTNQTYTGKAAGIADVTISGVGMYNNDILPLLELLGCDNLMSASEYNTKRWAYELLPPILNPLLDWVEDLADQPVSYVLDLLPKLAYLMEFDMLTEHIKNINVSIRASALFGLVDLDILETALGSNNLYDLLTSLLPADSGIDLAMLSDVNKLISFVLGMVAPDSNLVLPTIDQAYLASLGTLSQGSSLRLSGTRTVYTTDKAATLITVLRYVLPMLGDQDFMNALFALIGSMTGSEITLSDDIMNILKGLGSDPDGVICAATELFVPQEYASKELKYNYLPQVAVDEEGNPVVDEEGNPVMENQTINEVVYSEDWTKEQAQYISDNLTDFVNDMMVILGGADMPTLDQMIRSMIADQFYTNETINSIILMVMEQLNGLGMDLDPILNLVGVDLSSWYAVTEDTDWGVVPGDTATFKAALKEALSPFAPIMATLMSGEADLTILGAVTMKSYPGYQNGIIPILEALGCADEDIMSAKEYAELAATGDYDQMISAIIDPILNLVDEIYDDPINKLLDILPNVLYFINNGNLQIAVENALQSVFVLLDTIRPIYNLSFDLNLNLQQMITDLLADLEVNGQKLNLNIPFLTDLDMLAVGTVTEYTSKSGKTAYRVTDTDRADFITVLMRNVVELIFYEDNVNTVVDLVGSYANMNAEDLETLKEILNTFAEMYHEDNGVDKILNAVYVIFKGLHETGDDALTDLGDLNERWSAVFDTLYNSGNPVLEELAKAADEILDFLSFGFITGEGIGTAGLIDFAQRVLAFFQGRVTDVSISQTEASLYEGQSMTLSLSFKPVTVKNKNAVWTTSDDSVATVENGVVTAVGPGDAEITATTEDGGLVVSCVVRVRADKTALNEAIAFVESTELTEEQAAEIEVALNAAKYVANKELATQADVNSVTEALLTALKSMDLGGTIESVVITQNGQPVGDVVYQQVSWTKYWNSTPAELGLQINEDANVRSITWKYANWSVDDPEADIEAAEDGMSALIRAKNSVVGAHSCWIQVTVEDVYGNTVTSDPVKVRFYNWDWQK